MKWQPIETAPRDGKCILIHGESEPGTEGGRSLDCWSGNTAVAAWWGAENDGKGAWICYMSLPCDPEACFEPTHWMPLPSSPSREGSAG